MTLPPLPDALITMRELCERHRCSRQTCYQRLSVASFTPLKRGNAVYFDPSMVEELDAIHEALRAGFSLRDISDNRQLIVREVVDVSPVDDTQITPAFPSAPEPAPPNWLQLLTDALASALQQSSVGSPDDGLSTHRQLQEIADNDWLVSTKILAKVLGQSNSSLHSWGQETERHGFVFTRDGIGRFRVRRLSAPTAPRIVSG